MLPLLNGWSTQARTEEENLISGHNFSYRDLGTAYSLSGHMKCIIIIIIIILIIIIITVILNLILVDELNIYIYIYIIYIYIYIK